jgi:hypothetical protein
MNSSIPHWMMRAVIVGEPPTPQKNKRHHATAPRTATPRMEFLNTTQYYHISTLSPSCEHVEMIARDRAATSCRDTPMPRFVEGRTQEITWGAVSQLWAAEPLFDCICANTFVVGPQTIGRAQR